MQFDSNYDDDLPNNYHDHGNGSLLLSRTREHVRLSGIECLLRGHWWCLPCGEQLYSRAMQRHDHNVDDTDQHLALRLSEVAN